MDYMPRKGSIECVIINNIIEGGGGVEKSCFVKLLTEHLGHNRSLVDQGIEHLKEKGWLLEYEQPNFPGEFWLVFWRKDLPITRTDLEEGRHVFE